MRLQKNKRPIFMIALLCVMCVMSACGDSEGHKTESAGAAGSSSDAVSLSAENPAEETAVTLSAADSSAVVSSGSTEKESDTDQAEDVIGRMTTEEKVAQLFVVTPECITGVSQVVAAGEGTEKALIRYPVGGILYMGQNLQDTEQTKEMLSNTQRYSTEQTGLPVFLTVDEEGGTVSRISGKSGFGIEAIEDMSAVGASGDTDRAYQIGLKIGGYLSDLGFNMDFAPVADVLTNPSNEVVQKRAFSSDPDVVTQMTAALARGLSENGIEAVYKHFPGHGGTTQDSHEDYATSDKTLEELRQCDLIPFQNAIDNGLDFIMVGHISLPNIVGDMTPSSLSSVIVTDLLRNEMGFDGVAITDSMNMGAVTEHYSVADASVRAIQAGMDMILLQDQFESAYQAVLTAVKDGSISQARLDESLRRIISVKMKMGR